MGAVAFALPLVVVLAQSPTPQPNLRPIQQFLNALVGLVNTAIPLLIAVALAVFFWGLIRYVWRSGGGEGAKAGRDLMIWGLIALFVMVSVWGIIRLAQGAFGISGNERVPLPSVNPSGSSFRSGADEPCYGYTDCQ